MKPDFQWFILVWIFLCPITLINIVFSLFHKTHRHSVIFCQIGLKVIHELQRWLAWSEMRIEWLTRGFIF